MMQPLNLPYDDTTACPDCPAEWRDEPACPGCGLTVERVAERIAAAAARTKAEQPLRDALTRTAKWERDQDGLIRRGYEYAGIHEFVLREGTWFPAPTTPHRYPQGRPKACYGNAINIAAFYGLPYVEGFAASAVVPSLPVHHAWNLDGDGCVVDTTWGAYDDEGNCIVPIGVAYCGVEFSVERADDATWNQDATVIDDWEHNWPLLREKWTGEDPGREWPASIRLQAIRAQRDDDYELAARLYRQMSEEIDGV